MRPIIRAASLVCALALRSPPCAALPLTSSLDGAVYHAELVVVADVLPGGTVRVKEVLFSPAKVGELLTIGRLADLPREKDVSQFEAQHHAPRRFFGPSVPAKPAQINGDVLLLLGKGEGDGPGQWSLLSDIYFGIRWMTRDGVYSYQWVGTFRPLDLSLDRQYKDADHLRCAVQASLTKKARFTAALVVTDPRQRAEALTEYVPTPHGPEYWIKAVDEITAAGPAGGAVLRRSAERPELRRQRSHYLYALYKCDDPEAVPFLIDAARRAASLAKAQGPPPSGAISTEDRDDLNDWRATLSVLSYRRNPRARAVFLDALEWGAANLIQSIMLRDALSGLERSPHPDSVPPLARALASLPAGDHAQAVRRALNTIVGRDLGDDPKAWLDWHQSQKKPEPHP